MGRARLFRFRFANRFRNVLWQMAAKTIRTLPGQQLIENHPQRIDIARRGDRLADDLFWTGVFRRHHAQVGNGDLCSGFRMRLKDFGDAEIQQLWIFLRLVTRMLLGFKSR